MCVVHLLGEDGLAEAAESPETRVEIAQIDEECSVEVSNTSRTAPKQCNITCQRRNLMFVRPISPSMTCHVGCYVVL